MQLDLFLKSLKIFLSRLAPEGTGLQGRTRKAIRLRVTVAGRSDVTGTSVPLGPDADPPPTNRRSRRVIPNTSFEMFKLLASASQ